MVKLLEYDGILIIYKLKFHKSTSPGPSPLIRPPKKDTIFLKTHKNEQSSTYLDLNNLLI